MLITVEQLNEYIEKTKNGMRHEQAAYELGIDPCTWRRYRHYSEEQRQKKTKFQNLSSIRSELHGKTANEIAELYRERFGGEVQKCVLYYYLRRLRVRYIEIKGHKKHSRLTSDKIAWGIDAVKSGKITRKRDLASALDVSYSTIQRCKEIRAVFEEVNNG